MSRRALWITWALSAIAAIAAAIAAGRPIVIPLPPLGSGQPPGAPGEAPPAAPKADPLNAIVRIGRSGVGCSGTLIGPRRADGRYWVLSAAHCCDKIGERWVARFRDGRSTGLVVTALNRTADYAWMLTDVDTSDYPFAMLAEADPAVGSQIWHAGYGVHIPGNREDGRVNAGRNADGQIEFQLSVSSGDSGGGILLDSDGRVVSAVCCTTRPGGSGRVWGTSPVVALRGQTVAAWVDDWKPLDIPVVMPEEAKRKEGK